MKGAMADFVQSVFGIQGDREGGLTFSHVWALGQALRRSKRKFLRRAFSLDHNVLENQPDQALFV